MSEQYQEVRSRTLKMKEQYEEQLASAEEVNRNFYSSICFQVVHSKAKLGPLVKTVGRASGP